MILSLFCGTKSTNSVVHAVTFITGYAVPDADETSDVSYMASCVAPFLPWAGLIPVSIAYEGHASYSSEVYVSKYDEKNIFQQRETFA